MNIRLLLICLLAPLVLGSLPGIITAKQIPMWYAGLQKPWFNPPNWLFGPVWTMLFLLMGYALYRMLSSDAALSVKKKALLIFCIQFGLNLLWTFVVFGWHQLGWGLVEILLMWLAINATIIMFAGIDKLAAYLLLPYVVWVSFASILNFYLWRLNGG
jgi:translocator protein